VERLFAAQGLEVYPYMDLGSAEAIKQAVMAGWAYPFYHGTICAWNLLASILQYWT